MPLAVKYSGTHHSSGREVTVQCALRVRNRYLPGGEISRLTYHGHRLEIQVATSVATRLAISGPTNWLARLVAWTNRLQKASLVDARPALPDPPFQIWSTEPSWAAPFLQRPEVVPEIQKLLPQNALPPNIGIKWWPGHITYSQRLSLPGLREEQLAAWLDGVLRLAALAEQYPPLQHAELTKWEKWAGRNPVPAGCLICSLVGVATLVISFAVTALLVALAVLISR